MDDLRHKAHISLNEFRRGKGSPLRRHSSLSESVVSYDDNDELAMLGGKSRYVKKESTSPQILHRSPTSHNPVVPFPLSPSAETQVDANVLEYLHSFQPPQQSHSQPLSASTTNSQYSDIDMSPVSMYGMRNASQFSSEPVPYVGQSPTATTHQPRTMAGGENGLGTTNAFPQYFPVYDYGAPLIGNGYNSVPLLDANPIPGGSVQRRSSSGSPEGNVLHSTWNEFVASFSGA